MWQKLLLALNRQTSGHMKKKGCSMIKEHSFIACGKTRRLKHSWNGRPVSVRYGEIRAQVHDLRCRSSSTKAFFQHEDVRETRYTVIKMALRFL